MRLPQLATLVMTSTWLACGGNSSSPPAGPSTLLDLVPGSYALTITMSSFGEPVCTNGFCIAGGACVGVSTAPSVRALTSVVRLDRSGEAIAVRPEDGNASFRMDLSIAANTLTGTASGQLQDATRQLSLTISAGRPEQAAAAATGTLLATSVTGKIDGQVGIAGYSCSNNGHIWKLVPM